MAKKRPYTIAQRKARAKARYFEHKDEMNVRRKKWVENNREKQKEISRKSHYLNYHKTTITEMELLLKNQNGKCAICDNSISFCKGSTGANIDHCHTTNEIRGILCMECNTGLGRFKDNITLLFNAINYLRDFQKKQSKLIDDQVKEPIVEESLPVVKKTFVNPFEKKTAS